MNNGDFSICDVPQTVSEVLTFLALEYSTFAVRETFIIEIEILIVKLSERINNAVKKISSIYCVACLLSVIHRIDNMLKLAYTNKGTIRM